MRAGQPAHEGEAAGPGRQAAWRKSPEPGSVRYTPGGICLRFRDWYSTRNQQPDRLDLAVVDKASGQCVGEVVLNEWNDATAAAISARC